MDADDCRNGTVFYCTLSDGYTGRETETGRGK